MKRIGILTSGGDCSGLNSVIRAAFIRADVLGYELVGFKRGLRGIAAETSDYITFNDKICDSSMLTTSGSVIYSDTRWMSSSIENGKTVEDIKKMISDGYKRLGLDGLICVGGDGSIGIIDQLLLNNKDLNVVVVPKTIDNDVAFTDYSVGFQTVTEVVSDLVENVRATAKSHERAMVIEVMGRGAGFIAMYAGIASGADVILVPEFKYDFAKLIKKIRECYSSGKNHCILIVSESVEADDFKHDVTFVDGVQKYTQQRYNGIGQHLSDMIRKEGIESRAVNLGHVQRGGKTSVNDRLLGTMFGIEAVNLINSKNCGKLLCYTDNKVKSIDINDIASNITRPLTSEDPCVNAARSLGIYIGEL